MCSVLRVSRFSSHPLNLKYKQLNLKLHNMAAFSWNLYAFMCHHWKDWPNLWTAHNWHDSHVKIWFLSPCYDLIWETVWVIVLVPTVPRTPQTSVITNSMFHRCGTKCSHTSTQKITKTVQRFRDVRNMCCSLSGTHTHTYAVTHTRSLTHCQYKHSLTFYLYSPPYQQADNCRAFSISARGTCTTFFCLVCYSCIP